MIEKENGNSFKGRNQDKQGEKVFFPVRFFSTQTLDHLGQ